MSNIKILKQFISKDDKLFRQITQIGREQRENKDKLALLSKELGRIHNLIKSGKKDKKVKSLTKRLGYVESKVERVDKSKQKTLTQRLSLPNITIVNKKDGVIPYVS